MDIAVYEDEQAFRMRQLAELTQDGMVNWVCTEYIPLNFVLGDELEDSGPHLSQMFTFEAKRNGTSFELLLLECIDLQSGKGDIAVTVRRDGPEGFEKYDDALSFDGDRYDECAAEGLWDMFRDHTAVLFSTVVPVALTSVAVTETFEWARYVNENGVGTELLEHPLFKLGEKLFREHDLLAFHRCVLDVEYRQQLLKEME